MFDRIKRGVGVGLAFAVFYSAYVLILYLIRGAEPFERLDTNVAVVVGTYFFGGIAGGIVVGILQPIARWRLGAISVGIIAAFFVFFGIEVAADGLPWRWTSEIWITLIALPVLFGTFAGNSFWKKPIP